MTIYYAPSTRGFYDTGAFSYTLPDDAVAISKERHAELIAGQASGQDITTDAHGAPTLSDRPAPTLADWRAQATLSRLEMALALKASTILTHAEAMQLAGGTIPDPLAAFIALLPDQESREFAEIATIAGQPFERASPLWSAVAAAETGPTEAEIDALFGWT